MATDFETSVSKKSTSHRGKRALEDRAPKLLENDKSTLFVRGGHCSREVTAFLKDVYQLKKPNAVFLKNPNPIHPFEDETPLERFCKKYDSSLFAFGSHSKKRPGNLIFGRLNRFHVLDAFELGLDEFRSLAAFKILNSPLGVKPCLTFIGERFYTDSIYVRMRNFFVDFFRGPEIDQLRLQGVEYLLSFYVLANGNVKLKGFKIDLKKSGTKIPRVELTECGPSGRFQLRRTKLASDDLFKAACRRPKAAKVRTTKNISRDVFGTKLGRVHVKQQDLAQLHTRKLKGLKTPKAKKAKIDGDGEAPSKTPKIKKAKIVQEENDS